MKELKKLQEQERAADIVCQNFDFLVHSTACPKEKAALIKVRDNLRKIRALYQERCYSQARTEQLKIISIADYQNAKAR